MIPFLMLAAASSLGVYLTHNPAKPIPARPACPRAGGHSASKASAMTWKARRLTVRA